MRLFKDWRPLLVNWAGFTDEPASYRMRDGGVIHAREGMDAATIGVVVVRRDYGLPPANARVVLDIGANIGSFTVLAAKSAPESRVFSFEPDPAAHEVLARNVADNAFGERVKLYRRGVACADGPRVLGLSDHTAFNSLYGDPASDASITIECVSLDSVFAENDIERVDLLKIDCEGCEYEIFASASDDVMARVREIRMEYHRLADVEGADIESLTTLLGKRGFERTWIREDEPNSGLAWFKRSQQGS